jgi:hypothetical protein
MLSKFLNTKTLIVLLVILGGIYLITKLTEKEDRTFRSEMATIDSANVTKMIIMPKLGSDGKEVTITKTGYEWKLESEGKTYKADPSSVKNIMAELMRMKSERVAAVDESKWNEYEVSDSTGTRIQVYDGNKMISDLYVGKFDYTQPKGPQSQFQQNRGKMSTFVRPAEDKTVYVVDGFIKMSIQPNVDAYRDKTLVASNKDDLTKITFNYSTYDNFVLSKEEGKWFLNGMPTDSVKTNGYLNKLARLTSSNFIDDVEPLNNTPLFQVKIEGNNLLPIELKAFPADSTNKYIITSSKVPDAKYSGQKAGLFERIFVDRSEFFADEQE